MAHRALAELTIELFDLHCLRAPGTNDLEFHVKAPFKKRKGDRALMIEPVPLVCLFALLLFIWKTQLAYNWASSEHPRLLSDTLHVSPVDQLTLSEKPLPLSEQIGPLLLHTASVKWFQLRAPFNTGLCVLTVRAHPGGIREKHTGFDALQHAVDNLSQPPAISS